MPNPHNSNSSQKPSGPTSTSQNSNKTPPYIGLSLKLAHNNAAPNKLRIGSQYQIKNLPHARPSLPLAIQNQFCGLTHSQLNHESTLLNQGFNLARHPTSGKLLSTADWLNLQQSTSHQQRSNIIAPSGCITLHIPRRNTAVTSQNNNQASYDHNALDSTKKHSSSSNNSNSNNPHANSLTTATTEQKKIIQTFLEKYDTSGMSPDNILFEYRALHVRQFTSIESIINLELKQRILLLRQHIFTCSRLPSLPQHPRPILNGLVSSSNVGLLGNVSQYHRDASGVFIDGSYGPTSTTILSYIHSIPQINRHGDLIAPSFDQIKGSFPSLSQSMQQATIHHIPASFPTPTASSNGPVSSSSSTSSSSSSSRQAALDQASYQAIAIKKLLQVFDETLKTDIRHIIDVQMAHMRHRQPTVIDDEQQQQQQPQSSEAGDDDTMDDTTSGTNKTTTDSSSSTIHETSNNHVENENSPQQILRYLPLRAVLIPDDLWEPISALSLDNQPSEYVVNHIFVPQDLSHFDNTVTSTSTSNLPPNNNSNTSLTTTELVTSSSTTTTNVTDGAQTAAPATLSRKCLQNLQHFMRKQITNALVASIFAFLTTPITETASYQAAYVSTKLSAGNTASLKLQKDKLVAAVGSTATGTSGGSGISDSFSSDAASVSPPTPSENILVFTSELLQLVRRHFQTFFKQNLSPQQAATFPELTQPQLAALLKAAFDRELSEDAETAQQNAQHYMTPQEQQNQIFDIQSENHGQLVWDANELRHDIPSMSEDGSHINITPETFKLFYMFVSKLFQGSFRVLSPLSVLHFLRKANYNMFRCHTLLVERNTSHEHVAYSYDGDYGFPSDGTCFICGDGGNLILCEFPDCYKCYHQECLGIDSLPPGVWYCRAHSCSVCRSTSDVTIAHTHEFNPPRLLCAPLIVPGSDFSPWSQSSCGATANSPALPISRTMSSIVDQNDSKAAISRTTSLTANAVVAAATAAATATANATATVASILAASSASAGTAAAANAAAAASAAAAFAANAGVTTLPASASLADDAENDIVIELDSPGLSFQPLVAFSPYINIPGSTRTSKLYACATCTTSYCSQHVPTYLAASFKRYGIVEFLCASCLEKEILYITQKIEKQAYIYKQQQESGSNSSANNEARRRLRGSGKFASQQNHSNSSSNGALHLPLGAISSTSSTGGGGPLSSATSGTINNQNSNTGENSGKLSSSATSGFLGPIIGDHFSLQLLGDLDDDHAGNSTSGSILSLTDENRLFMQQQQQQTQQQQNGSGVGSNESTIVEQNRHMFGRLGWLSRLLLQQHHINQSMTEFPTIEGKPLNLYKLYGIMLKYGGFANVLTNNGFTQANIYYGPATLTISNPSVPSIHTYNQLYPSWCATLPQQSSRYHDNDTFCASLGYLPQLLPASSMTLPPARNMNKVDKRNALQAVAAYQAATQQFGLDGFIDSCSVIEFKPFGSSVTGVAATTAPSQLHYDSIRPGSSSQQGRRGTSRPTTSSVVADPLHRIDGVGSKFDQNNTEQFFSSAATGVSGGKGATANESSFNSLLENNNHYWFPFAPCTRTVQGTEQCIDFDLQQQLQAAQHRAWFLGLPLISIVRLELGYDIEGYRQHSLDLQENARAAAAVAVSALAKLKQLASRVDPPPSAVPSAPPTTTNAATTATTTTTSSPPTSLPLNPSHTFIPLTSNRKVPNPGVKSSLGSTSSTSASASAAAAAALRSSLAQAAQHASQAVAAAAAAASIANNLCNLSNQSAPLFGFPISAAMRDRINNIERQIVQHYATYLYDYERKHTYCSKALYVKDLEDIKHTQMTRVPTYLPHELTLDGYYRDKIYPSQDHVVTGPRNVNASNNNNTAEFGAGNNNNNNNNDDMNDSTNANTTSGGNVNASSNMNNNSGANSANSSSSSNQNNTSTSNNTSRRGNTGNSNNSGSNASSGNTGNSKPARSGQNRGGASTNNPPSGSNTGKKPSASATSSTQNATVSSANRTKEISAPGSAKKASAAASSVASTTTTPGTSGANSGVALGSQSSQQTPNAKKSGNVSETSTLADDENNHNSNNATSSVSNSTAKSSSSASGPSDDQPKNAAVAAASTTTTAASATDTTQKNSSPTSEDDGGWNHLQRILHADPSQLTRRERQIQREQRMLYDRIQRQRELRQAALASSTSATTSSTAAPATPNSASTTKTAPSATKPAPTTSPAPATKTAATTTTATTSTATSTAPASDSNPTSTPADSQPETKNSNTSDVTTPKLDQNHSSKPSTTTNTPLPSTKKAHLMHDSDQSDGEDISTLSPKSSQKASQVTETRSKPDSDDKHVSSPAVKVGSSATKSAAKLESNANKSSSVLQTDDNDDTTVLGSQSEPNEKEIKKDNVQKDTKSSTPLVVPKATNRHVFIDDDDDDDNQTAANDASTQLVTPSSQQQQQQQQQPKKRKAPATTSKRNSEKEKTTSKRTSTSYDTTPLTSISEDRASRANKRHRLFYNAREEELLQAAINQSLLESEQQKAKADAAAAAAAAAAAESTSTETSADMGAANQPDKPKNSED